MLHQSAAIPEAIVECFLSCNSTNANGPLLPDTILGEYILHLIQPFSKLADEFIDVIHEANWDVLV